MSKNSYSIVDRMASDARQSVESGGASVVLSFVMLLSAALSAIFFWQNSLLVFRDVHPTLALILGLAVGLIPSEGAFFGWRQIREVKRDMTQGQLMATKTGIVTAVVTSIFSTLALYVLSFSYVPGEISVYRDWLVFLALSLPLVCQVAIFAWFSVNERSVVENHERAKLDVMKFNAWVKSEQARLGAVMVGMKQSLEEQLEGYGAAVGSEEAAQVLDKQRPSGNGNGSAAPPPVPADLPAGTRYTRAIINGREQWVLVIPPLNGSGQPELNGQPVTAPK